MGIVKLDSQTIGLGDLVEAGEALHAFSALKS